MYNKFNDFKGEGKYYYFGLIKYGKNDRIVFIYVELKEFILFIFVGFVVMLS